MCDTEPQQLLQLLVIIITLLEKVYYECPVVSNQLLELEIKNDKVPYFVAEANIGYPTRRFFVNSFINR